MYRYSISVSNATLAQYFYNLYNLYNSIFLKCSKYFHGSSICGGGRFCTCRHWKTGAMLFTSLSMDRLIMVVDLYEPPITFVHLRIKEYFLIRGGMYARKHLHTCDCTHASTYVSTVHVCMYIPISTYLCIYACINVRMHLLYICM